MRRKSPYLLAICALTLLLSLVAVASGHSAAGGHAFAASGEDLGPVPTELPVSRCAPVSFSPHVVKVGEEITGTAGPATDECGGPVSSVSWVWDAEGLSVVSGCGQTSSSCVMRATAPTGTAGHRYVPGCITGSSPFGGWESCDYYAVEGCGGAKAAAHTAGLVVEACCAAQPSVTATARVVRSGRAVEVVAVARNLGSRKECGKATLDSNRGAVFAVKRSGSSEVGRATLSGRQSCFVNIAASVRLQRGGSASTTTDVAGGTPTIETARARRTAGGTIALTAKIADLRARSACGAATIDATTARATRSSTQVAVVKRFSGTTATAHASLNRSNECLTVTNLTVRQGGIEGATARAVRVTGKQPTVCTMQRESP